MPWTIIEPPAWHGVIRELAIRRNGNQLRLLIQEIRRRTTIPVFALRVVPVGREEMEALKKRVPSHDGFGRRESRQKGRWITAQILHRLCPDLSSRTVSAQRTESHTISILPLPVDARITLQKLINTHNSTGMKNELEASRGKEEGGPKVDSGTRGREFESHRPDHF